MFNIFKSVPTALAAAAILAVMPVPSGSMLDQAVAAQEKPKSKQKTRKVPAMSLEVHKQVQKAQEAMDLEDIPAAEEYLEKAMGKRNINDYEKAVVWQIRAMIAFEKEDTPATIRAYEKILSFRESIPEAQEQGILYGLGQLYFSQEDYKTSLRYIKDWQAQVDPSLIGVNQLVFIGQLYYQLQDFPKTLEYIYDAIAQAETVDTIEVKENWYNIALSAHFELNQYEKVRDVLEVLLINWPKPNYWTQLASIYQQLGQDITSYAITEAAYKQGFLDDNPSYILNVAQMQLSRSAPIKCAWILEDALDKKLIKDDADNELLLGQCYLAATEYRKALAPLSIAAEKDNNGDTWLQVARIQMQLTDYKTAVSSLESVEKALKDVDAKDKSAKEKLNEKVMSTLLLKGQALTELKRFKEARTAFANAKRLAKGQADRKTVARWVGYLSSEEQREKLLTGR
jgi:tetratricopeptide (TPR) repeat protein